MIDSSSDVDVTGLSDDNEEEEKIKFMESSGKVILLLKLLDKFKM